MAEPFVIREMSDALNRRLYPTVTAWNRLEGRPRTRNFDRALRAESRDPLFMLSAQLRLGEFTVADAGSPVNARVRLETSTVLYRTGLAAREFGSQVPVEAQAERRPVRFTMAGRKVSLDLRVRMGRYWLKLIANLGKGSYQGQFKDIPSKGLISVLTMLGGARILRLYRPSPLWRDA